MQQHINGYLDQAYSATERYSVGYFRVLHSLARMLLKNLRNVRYGAFITYIYRQTKTPDYRLDNRRAELRELPIKQRADVFNIAAWLLEEWPDRLIKLCTKHGINGESMLNVVYDPPLWFEKAMDKLPHSAWKEDGVPSDYSTPQIHAHEIEQTRKRWRYDFDDQEDYYSGSHSYIDLNDNDDRLRDLHETLYSRRYPDLFYSVA
ncbi:hypothetical protein [Mucilaginibacter pineti]|nr:hypothetical protein [Mucilaginibacter pineti]